MAKDKSERKVYGLHACEAVWGSRPEDIIRVYILKELVPRFGPLLKWCAENKKAYHIVPADELKRICSSAHHEGICLLARSRESEDFTAALAKLESLPSPRTVLVLDGIGNPHNFGSILRTAANFGVTMVLGRTAEIPTLSGAVARVSVGAAESANVVATDDLRGALSKLAKINFRIVSSSPRGKTLLSDYAFAKDTVIILGGERSGVSAEILSESHDNVTIPGSGQTESLNVSASTAVLLWERWKQL